MSEESLIETLNKRLASHEYASLKAFLYESVDNAKNRQVFEWIHTKFAEQGHCLLMYMIVRNALKQPILYLPQSFDNHLAFSIFFLIRVAEDCVAARQVNGFTRSTEVFSLFSQKIRKWLIPFESRIVTAPQEQSSWWIVPGRRSNSDWPGVG
jgi:hypothetical protein